MTYPDDLPILVEYRVGCTVRPTLPRRPVVSISTSGVTDAVIICPQIPYGCDGWRLPGETDFRPLASIPGHWRPFLQRKRGTALDPRPDPDAEKVRRR